MLFIINTQIFDLLVGMVGVQIPTATSVDQDLKEKILVLQSDLGYLKMKLRR